MKRFLVLLVLFVLGYGFFIYNQDIRDLPALQEGDLIFQTSWTDQSIAIGLATGSLYIHTGILKKTDKGWVVIHAANKVEEWPLAKWINSGILKRFAIYRYRNLREEQVAQLLEAAGKYYGRPYDHYFSFDNDTIYCSELEYLAFRDTGLPLGTPQRIESMYVNNRFVKQLIEQRWQNYPACRDKHIDFEECYGIIMSQALVSPIAIANDPNLDLIFSNYPF